MLLGSVLSYVPDVRDSGTASVALPLCVNSNIIHSFKIYSKSSISSSRCDSRHITSYHIMSHHVTVAAERTPAQRSQQSLRKLPSPSGKSHGQHRRQSEAPRRHPRRRLRPAGQLHSAHTCVTQPDVGYACVVLKCESVLGVKTLLRYLVKWILVDCVSMVA